MRNQKKLQQVLAVLSVKWKRRDNLIYCKLIAKDEETEVLPDRNKHTHTHINFDSLNCLGFIVHLQTTAFSLFWWYTNAWAQSLDRT